MGATASTFTGNYEIGTVLASDAPRPVPFLTYRRTTAHDLGRILFELHAAAAGNRLSLRRTGLTRHEARVALGLLLSTDPRGDNAGLFRRPSPRACRWRRSTAGRRRSATAPRSSTARTAP